VPIPKGSKIQPWDMGQIRLLREHYRTRGPAWCAAQLIRSVQSVWSMARRCGLAWRERLTDSQREFVAAHCRTMNDAEIALELGVSRYTVRNCRRRLGRRYGQGRRATRCVNLVARARLLELHQRGMTDSEIATETGRGPTSVMRMRRAMKLPPNPRSKLREGGG
jgi:transposase-like protein